MDIMTLDEIKEQRTFHERARDVKARAGRSRDAAYHEQRIAALSRQIREIEASTSK